MFYLDLFRALQDAEVRYLRLVNTFYLPGLFGRKDDAREDMKVLASLITVRDPATPKPLHRTMATFVLRNGGLATAEAERLRRAIEQDGDA